MKIQIDTTQKVIKLESSENLGELIETLETMLPEGLWKEFKLETNTTIAWTNPIIWRDIYVKPYINPVLPYNPYPTYPWITYTGDTVKPVLCNGTFNVTT